MRPDSMSRKWRRFLEESDLPSIRFHDLWHSNATALIQAGVNPRVVQQRLGHSDVNITLNTYTHVLPEMDVDAAEKLDAIMLKKA
ncbi:MAG: tyrosine-type recombinase/integrase [Clostridia bacterium]|nr:tyrosine-type recombinase/integrase [Clostridia bacterium]